MQKHKLEKLKSKNTILKIVRLIIYLVFDKTIIIVKTCNDISNQSLYGICTNNDL